MNRGLGILVHHSKRKGENSGDLITTIYSEEEGIKENPHHHNIVPGTEQRKLQDMPSFFWETTIWEHLFCLKGSDLSDPGQSRSHTFSSQAVNCGWNRNRRDGTHFILLEKQTF